MNNPQDLRKNLYLIRKGLRVISGPFTHGEVGIGFQNMEIGVLDEICGNAGPWIQLSLSDKLKQIYPSIASIVISRNQLSDSLLSSKNKNAEQVKIRFAPSKKADVQPKKNFVVIIASILFGVVLLLFLRISVLNYLATKSSSAPTVAISKPTNFFEFDCQKSLFETKWTESQPGGRTFASGLFTPKNPLLKILLWDPYWIARHADAQILPLPPKAFFENCFTTMKTTITNLNVVPRERDFVKVVLERLKNQLNILHGVFIVTPTVDWTHSLQVLGCLDFAISAQDFDRCHQFQKKLDPDFQRVMEDYEKFQMLRVALSENRADDLVFSNLKRMLPDFPVDGSLGRLDYRGDLKIFKEFAGVK